MKRVEVEWVHSNMSTGWVSTNYATKIADNRPLECRTIGYLLSETEDRINVAMNFADNTDLPNDSLSEVMTIPKVSVLSIKELRIK